jgi:hypothetical protein
MSKLHSVSLIPFLHKQFSHFLVGQEALFAKYYIAGKGQEGSISKKSQNSGKNGVRFFSPFSRGTQQKKCGQEI